MGEEIISVPRSTYDVAVKALGKAITTIQQLGEDFARETADLARVRREMLEANASDEALSSFDKVLAYGRRVQITAITVKGAAQTGYRELRSCDPELTPVRSPSQMAMQAFRASQNYSERASDALKDKK